MTYFLLLLTLSSIFIMEEKSFFKKKHFAFFLVLIVVVFVAGFRYNVGYDYRSYEEIMTDIKFYDFGSMIREPINYLLLILSNTIFEHQFYFLINALITCSLIVYISYLYSDNWRLSTWIFITFPMFFLNSLSIVRFFTALSITFYSFKYIKTGDLRKYIYAIVIAMFFHNSAIMAFPIYFIKKIDWRKKSTFLILLSIFILVPLFKELIITIFPRYHYVFDGNKPIAGNKTLLVIIAVVLFSLLSLRLMQKNNERIFLLNILIIGLIVNILFYNYNTLGYRGALFYYIYLILYIPEFISDFTLVNYKKMTIFTYIIFVPMLLYMIYVGGDFYNPYQFRFKIISNQDNSNLKESLIESKYNSPFL